MTRPVRALAPALVLASSCTGARAPATVAPAPVEATAVRVTPLPPMPRVIGRLDLRVVYPAAGALIAARDSNFIFGSVGSGEAALTVNGARVTVHPNGSFLGFLPVPDRERPYYDLVVSRGADTARLRHTVSLSRRPLALPRGGAVLADTLSLTPRGTHWRMPNETVRVAIRSAPDARVTVVAADGREALLVRSRTDSLVTEGDVPIELLGPASRVIVARGPDSLIMSAPRGRVVGATGRVLATLGAAASTLPDTDRVVIARPVSGGTYKWFLLPETVVQVTGRSNGLVRIALDADLDVWVDSAEVRELELGSVLPTRVVGNARVLAGPEGEWTDIVLPMGDRPSYSVDATANGLVLTLYSTVANTDIINYASADSLVARVTWEQVRVDRARYHVDLRDAIGGYLVLWRRGALVLRVRRQPRVDPVRPLAGLRIAVDAGHPPAGSTGPTGLYEAVATLAIAERLRALLEQRGAAVIMVRTGPSALGLTERPMLARRANAHALVSIHLNALPDGVNPFNAHGTGTYYFTPHSVDLARSVQAGMVGRLGLRDLGINYDNLAVIRPTWMPAVLCEGAFLMIPEQEAALRVPAYQEAYALGVAEGLEQYFKRLAGSRRTPR